MFRQANFVQTVVVPGVSKTENNLKFYDNVEFTLHSQENIHSIKDIKGDFEITKILETENFAIFEGYPSTCEMKYAKSSTDFRSTSRYHYELTFYITAKIELKEMCVLDKPLAVADETVMKVFKEMCAAEYHLKIPSDRLQCLELYHYFKSVFVIPGYDGLKFTYYVKKIKEAKEGNDIKLHIETPYDVKIQGKKRDFIVVQNSTDGIDLNLHFTFFRTALNNLLTVADENVLKNVANNAEEQISDDTTAALNEPTHASAINENCPESVISTPISSNEPSTSKLFKIGSNIRFADVFFLTSDGKRIPSHRNILAEFSETFTQIFEETSEIPVLINVEDFEAEIIQSALHYLYDIPDAINGKEMEIFKFAVKFRIQHLIDACRHSFEDSVSPTNVCEFVKFAYDNNLEALKQKRLQILVQKKKEIDSTKVSLLPKKILFDVYCFEM